MLQKQGGCFKIDPKIIRSMEIVYADKIDDVVKEALRQPKNNKNTAQGFGHE